MLISNIYKTNFINYKKKRTLLENVNKKLIYIILFLFLTSFYFLTKTNNSFTETKFNSLSNKQLIGGCIGIFGYILVKEIGGWGWHYGDIIGLVLLAFLPGAIFIGGMLENG